MGLGLGRGGLIPPPIGLSRPPAGEAYLAAQARRHREIRIGQLHAQAEHAATRAEQNEADRQFERALAFTGPQE